MSFQKHIVECHCILPLYKNSKKTVYHKFPVFSLLDDAGKVIPKYQNCNNCGITHLVYELCKSDIKIGNEDLPTIRSIEDISFSLPDKINKLLLENNCLIDTYEEIEYIFDNEVYPSTVFIGRKRIDEDVNLKMLEIKSESRFSIKSELFNTTIIAENTK